jgi:Flp pilus assembly pilin Flp
MKRVHQLWSRCTRFQTGQTMAEYALIVALVAVVGLAAWALLGTNITSTINKVASCV